MTIARKSDHVDEALTLLLEQYKGKPRIEALLSSYIRRVQELEDAAWDVLIKRLIDNAEDAQLDALGRIVGESRQGKDDATYRIYILARIRINWSSGHADDVIEVLRIVEAAAHEYSELHPATIIIEFLDATNATPQVLLDLARQARGAGVRIGVTVPTVPVANTFAFSDAVGGGNDPNRGFGHAGSDEHGGVFSSFYE